MKPNTPVTKARTAEPLILCRMKAGSHLFGTATPESDLDIRGVHVPAFSRVVLSGPHDDVIRTCTKTDQAAKNSADDVDVESLAFRRFANHVADGQPTAVELLFAPEDAYLETPHERWVDIARILRSVALNSNVYAAVGYCRQQANKYGIKGSRMAAAKGIIEVLECAPPNDKLAGIGLALHTFCTSVEHAEIVDITASNRPLKHLSVCNKKAPFTITVKAALAIYQKLYDEYGERTRQAMEDEGIDWKAISHAVRVLGQTIELLDTGMITLPRPDRKFLLQVKTGQFAFGEISEHLDLGFGCLELARARSALPPRPDFEALDSLIVDVYRELST